MRGSFRVSMLSAAGAMSLLLLSTAQAAELTQGAMLSVSCAGCHGTDGKSPGSIPNINGKSVDFISAAMLEFRSGTRESTVMGRHAKGYTTEEIQLIAEYMASRK